MNRHVIRGDIGHGCPVHGAGGACLDCPCPAYAWQPVVASDEEETMTKPGLSPERHTEIGRELAWISDRLTALAVEIANAYPKNGRVSRTALGLIEGRNSLPGLRHVLEDEMFRQYGGADVLGGDDPGWCTTRVYFPHAQDRKPPAGADAMT
jgi:hypothetical protein